MRRSLALLALVAATSARADLPPCTGLGDINMTTVADDHPQVCRLVNGTAQWVHAGLDVDADVTLDFPSMLVGGCATLTATPTEFASVPASSPVWCVADFDMTGGAFIAQARMSGLGEVSIKVCSLGVVTDPPSGVFSCTVPL